MPHTADAILALADAAPGDHPALLVRQCARLTGTSAVVALLAGDGGLRPGAAFPEPAHRLLRLDLSLGGPLASGLRTGRPVHAAPLAGWPDLAAAAAETGLTVVDVLPLHGCTGPLGVLGLYGPEPLDPAGRGVAQALADTAGIAMSVTRAVATAVIRECTAPN